MRDWWLETTILSIPLWSWVLAAGVAVVVFAVLMLAFKLLRSRLQRRLEGKHGLAAELILRVMARTSFLVVFVFSVLIGMKMLDLPLSWRNNISTLWFVAVIFQVAMWLDAALILSLQRYLARRSNLNAVTVTLMAFTSRAVLWVVAVLAILDNVGVNITAFVASLGIGGVAVALAAQVVLSDLFASISIGLDKPFEQGDFIVVGGIAGSIEHVGLKTTRIRSLGGEQIVCSNTELLKQTIQNYKRMDLRRIAFRFTLSYRTNAAEASEIPGRLKTLIAGTEDTRFDRAHLLQFAERGLEYEVVYYVLSADYNRYMDIQQRINLAIMRELEERKICFGWQELNVRMEAQA